EAAAAALARQGFLHEKRLGKTCFMLQTKSRGDAKPRIRKNPRFPGGVHLSQERGLNPRPHDSSSRLWTTRAPSAGNVFPRLIRGFRARAARRKALRSRMLGSENAFVVSSRQSSNHQQVAAGMEPVSPNGHARMGPGTFVIGKGRFAFNLFALS